MLKAPSRDPSGFKRDMKDAIAKAEAAGWTVRMTKSGHWAFYAPPPSKAVVHTSGTTGKPSAWRNFVAQLRRAGFDIDAGERTKKRGKADAGRDALGRVKAKASGWYTRAKAAVTGKKFYLAAARRKGGLYTHLEGPYATLAEAEGQRRYAYKEGWVRFRVVPALRGATKADILRAANGLEPLRSRDPRSKSEDGAPASSRQPLGTAKKSGRRRSGSASRASADAAAAYELAADVHARGAEPERAQELRATARRFRAAASYFKTKAAGRDPRRSQRRAGGR